jgi:hypothetical protein
MQWNTHSRSPRFTGARRGVFSIVLVGNQIADSVLEVRPGAALVHDAHISQFGASRVVWTITLFAVTPGKEKFTPERTKFLSQLPR